MVDKIWYNMEELIGGSEERVLIETYWNVKTLNFLILLPSLKSINRNILECKDSLGRCVSPYLQVLIETYWNVKAYCLPPSFNDVDVLIETYWNVKKYTQTADLGYIPY